MPRRSAECMTNSGYDHGRDQRPTVVEAPTKGDADGCRGLSIGCSGPRNPKRLVTSPPDCFFRQVSIRWFDVSFHRIEHRDRLRQAVNDATGIAALTAYHLRVPESERLEILFSPLRLACAASRSRFLSGGLGSAGGGGFPPLAVDVGWQRTTASFGIKRQRSRGGATDGSVATGARRRLTPAGHREAARRPQRTASPRGRRRTQGRSDRWTITTRRIDMRIRCSMAQYRTVRHETGVAKC